MLYLVVALFTGVSARKRETFDFGWRYILGDQGYKPAPVPVSPPAPDGSGFCSFNRNISGTQCYGLSNSDAASMDECAAACCLDYGCGLYVRREPHNHAPQKTNPNPNPTPPKP
jgi:hypothetical protein